MKILRLLPTIQVLVAQSDDSDLKHLCTEHMVATGLLTLLLDIEGKYKKETVSKADVDHDKIEDLRGLIQEFESRYEYLK